jgi:hypothetical protein
MPEHLPVRGLAVFVATNRPHAFCPDCVAEALGTSVAAVREAIQTAAVQAAVEGGPIEAAHGTCFGCHAVGAVVRSRDSTDD